MIILLCSRHCILYTHYIYINKLENIGSLVYLCNVCLSCLFLDHTINQLKVLARVYSISNISPS